MQRIGLFLVLVLMQGCTGGVVSSGAKLPQAPTDFGNNLLQVSVSHRCSAGRCKSFSAKFENRTADPITILVSSSRLQRAGAGLVLAREGKEKGPLVVPPRSKVSETFIGLAPESQRPMSWAVVEDVWCSLKVDSQCNNKAKIEEAQGKCNGLARYYFQSYTSAEGWISVKFSIKTNEGTEVIETNRPGFFGAPPPLPLTSGSGSPMWSSKSRSTAYYRMECDAKCNCKELDKARSFQVDDRFLPVEP